MEQKSLLYRDKFVVKSYWTQGAVYATIEEYLRIMKCIPLRTVEDMGPRIWNNNRYMLDSEGTMSINPDAIPKEIVIKIWNELHPMIINDARTLFSPDIPQLKTALSLCYM